MGELLDQIMSGGPEQLPLPVEAEAVKATIESHPGEWRWSIAGTLPAIRSAIRELPPDTLDYRVTAAFEWLEWMSSLAAHSSPINSDDLIRELLLIAGWGPGFRPAPVSVYAAFRGAMAKRLHFRDANAELQMSCRYTDALPWDLIPERQFMALCASARVISAELGAA